MEGCKAVSLVLFLFLHPQNTRAFNKCAHKILENDEKIPQNEIIDFHNKFRTMVVNGSTRGQPRAASAAMNFLKWDSKLEQWALEVSKTCEFKYVDIISDEYPHGLGQNLYRSCSNKKRKPNWRKVVSDWYNESRIYKYPEEPTVMTGHYTQLVWADSKQLGCAFTEYFTGNSSRVPYCTLYVCHYSPRGNLKGVAPYKLG